MQKQKITYSLFILILSILFSFQVKAQIYPIQVNTQLIPPYSLRLSDYVSPGTNRVSVNMLLTDINEPEYYIRLELLIEGAGITIRTSPTFNPSPILLQGGIPEFLTSSDLYEWFQPQNLDFSGYSKSDYLSTDRLPEGVYRISFIAYDFYKKTRVSNNTAITTWLLLNDPPIINLPFPDYKVEHIDPQNIVFQWTPRHTGSPNSAFTTEYEFTMVEIWPEGRDPNNAMQTSFPIFQTTTTNTNLVYGLAEPFLEPGRQYAYQIQARDMDGRDMFKNNGYSEVRMFTFGEACKPITNIEAKAEKYFEAEILWTPGFNQTAFSLRYRKANYPGAEWFEKDSNLDHIKLSNLEELTTYEYQVMAYCGTYESDYSEIQTFTTPKQKVSNFECGAGEEISPITNHDPLPTLNAGDHIWSGTFMFEIKEATGSNGTFSGKAFAMIPYLGYIKLLAEFKNIKINTDNRVYEGEIKSVYNPDSPFILGLDTDNDDDDNNGDNDNTTDGNESEISDTTFTSDIDSIYIDDDIIIIVTEDGTDTIHTTDDIIITDEDGDTWIVDGGEVVTGGGGTGPGGGGDPTGDGTTPAVSSTEVIKIKAEFIQNENQYYGFDKLKYELHKPQYEQVSIYDKQEYVPWKSISSFGSDKVLVKISDSDASFTVDHVKYRTSSGIEITPFTYQGQEDTRMLMLNGKADTETEGIEAYITYKNANDTTENEKEIVIGKLNTLSLDKLKINLVIVPVNGSAGFSETDFTNALNDIYQQSVVEWNVTVEDIYNINQDDWDEDEDGKMNDGESTLLSNYSDEQIKFKRQYKSDRDMDNDAYYVFVMSDIPSKTGLAGYMPLKGQYAFIHSATGTNAAQDDLSAARLIAHELGHGAFRLWHTFSSESDYYMAEKSSENLMDYNDGEELHKYQWNKIHNPDGGFYMFQDEEEGAMVDIYSLLSDIRQANLDEKEIYEITKDQCPEVGYKEVSIGEDKLSYLGIKCTDDFVPTEEEQIEVEFVEWSLEFGEKVKLMPEFKNKTYFNSTLGNAVSYSFYEAKENNPPLENEQTSNKLFELLILEKDINNFEEYLFPTEVVFEETIDVEKFLEDTETATKVASQYTSATACNICVRSALYILKKDSVLFPSTGSGYNDPNNNYTSREIKGYITPDGRAIYIKSDFDNITNNAKLKERFTQIERKEDEDWEDYFERLQNEADRGIIVIGVMLNSNGTVGHIMMITPGGVILIDEEEQSWGDTFVSRGIEKVPRVLECGDTDRENEAPLCRNVDRAGAIERLIWFKYIK